MATRLILQLDGNIAIDGMPQIDVTQREIAVANTSGLEYWPGLYSWDLNESKNGFRDRVTDAACPVYTPSDLSSRFTNFADGYPGYYISGEGDALIKSDFPASGSGSFTIGATVGFEMSAGSINTGTGYWYLSTSNGYLRYNLGGVGITYTDYTGPLLSSSKMTAVVFIYDREAGELRLRVNGALVKTTAATSLKTAAVQKGLAFGRTNVNGTVQTRIGHYRVAAGFSKVLTGIDLANFEGMLMESVI